MGRIWLVISAVAALALAGAGASFAADTGDPLGKDLAGESCSFGVASGAGASLRIVPILCGGREGAGALYSAPLAARPADDAAARRGAMIAAAKSMQGGLGRGAELRCDDGAPVAADGDSLLFACAFASTGWPRIVLLVAAGGALYQGEGIPALLPVLQAAIAQSSGRALPPGETEGALRLLEQRFPGALARAGGAEAASDTALVELARLDAAQRNYAGAEAGYRRALEIETRLFGDKGAAVGETVMELALQVSNQGRFDEAAGLFRRAQPMIDASANIAARARLQSYLALDAANQRHFADALAFARAATEMRRAELDARQGGGGVNAGVAQLAQPSRGELAHSLRIEAAMAMKLGDLPTALVAAQEVLRIVGDEPGLPLWWRPDAVAMMADINAQQGRTAEAESQYREAFVMDGRLFGDTAPTAFAALRLGRFYADQQLYPTAVAVFRQALAILGRDEVARAAIQPDQLVPFLAAGSALAARDAKDATALNSEMFRASQLATSDVEGRTIARTAARLASDKPALAELMRAAQEAQRKRDSARIALAAENAKANDQRDPAREQTLAADVQSSTAKAKELTQQIDKGFPDYAKLADPGPAELASVAQRLGAREAFLSFLIGTGSSYALLVTSGGLTVARLDETQAALAADVAELRQAFAPRLGGLPDFDLAAAYELYRRLLGPLEGKLDGVDHLIVAPSGALASLPLALLVTQKPQAGTRGAYADAAWLVRRLAVSEVPSARAFLTLREAGQRRAPAAKPLLAVADPSFTGTAQSAEGRNALGALAGSCRAEGPVAGDLIRALPPLHETANEVRTVARLLGAGDDAILLGARRDREQFPGAAARSIWRALFRDARALAGRASLPVRARAGAVAAARGGAHCGRRRAPRCERDRRAQAQRGSRRAVGLQHRGERRRGARGARRSILQCRRARPPREPLGGAVGLDREADDRPLREFRQDERHGPRRGAAPVAARAHPRRGHRASLQLGSLHRDRRRRQAAAALARRGRERAGPVVT